jgi:hypothetical protein
MSQVDPSIECADTPRCRESSAAACASLLNALCRSARATSLVAAAEELSGFSDPSVGDGRNP